LSFLSTLELEDQFYIRYLSTKKEQVFRVNSKGKHGIIEMESSNSDNDFFQIYFFEIARKLKYRNLVFHSQLSTVTFFHKYYA
jgi:hypothetical protein